VPGELNRDARKHGFRAPPSLRIYCSPILTVCKYQYLIGREPKIPSRHYCGLLLITPVGRGVAFNVHAADEAVLVEVAAEDEVVVLG